MQRARFRSLTLPYAGVDEALAARTEKDPDAIAVDGPDAELSFGELAASIDAVATRLLSDSSPRPGKRVAVALPRTSYLPAVIFGIWRAGGVYVPIDLSLPESRRRWVLEDAKAEVLLCDRTDEVAVPEGMPILRLPNLLQGRGETPPHLPTLRPDSQAYVMHTSGSTGRPKRVEIEHGSLMLLATGLGEVYGLDAGDRVLQYARPAWDTHLEEIVPALCAGATVVIPPWESPRELDDPIELAASKGTSLVSLPTTLWMQLTRLETAWPACVRIAVVGGEPMRGSDLARWFDLVDPRPRLFNTYGLTEACAVSAVGELTGPLAGDSTFAPIGAPLPGTEVVVQPENGSPVVPETPGDLLIKGGGLSRGAWRADGVSFVTGDLAVTDASGAIVVVGRRDDQVKVRGVRVSLAEVEAALCRPDYVVAGAVVAVEEGTGGIRLVAAAELKRGSLADELLEALAAELHPAAVPQRLTVMDRIPTLPSGKVDRQAVREMLAERDDDRASEDGDATVSMTLVGKLVGQAIGLPSVDLDSHFLDLGGDSLAAMIVVGQLRAAGFRAEVDMLLDAPTIRAFGVALAEGPVRRPANRSTPPTPGGPEGHPLTPSQEIAYQAAMDPLPGPQCYLDQDIWRIDGELDVDAFLIAWDLLQGWHSSLRSCFRAIDENRATQIVEPPVEPPVVVQDWSGLAPEARSDALDALCARDLAEHADLAQAPLYRVHLLRCASSEWWMVWTVHRLILDGWSTAIALKQLLDTYGTLTAGGAPTDPQAPPFRRFAETVRAIDQRPAHDYWRPRIAAVDGPIEIAGMDVRGGRSIRSPLSTLAARIEGREHRALLESCRLARATLSTAVRGAWGSMLLRRSGEERVIFGATTSLRAIPLPGVERMTGFMINWQPVVQTATEDEDWLASFQREQATAYEYAAADPRTLLASCDLPFFDSVVTVQNYPGASRPIGAGGLILTPHAAREQVHYPVSLVARPQDEALDLVLTFDESRLELALAREILAETATQLPTRQRVDAR